MLDLSLQRDFDAICLGRAGMDLYAVEHGRDFADVEHFRKSVGGSPANIAVGMARLNSPTGFIGKLSDDVVGHFVRDFLNREKVDTGGLGIDNCGTRTSLALTEIRPDNCNVIIYRNNASDLALAPEDISEDYIRRARILVVSGTALSASPSRDAVFTAIDYATHHNVLVLLDLDYRAYTWQSAQEAADIYQRAAAVSTLLVGNQEEYEVLGVPPDSDAAAVADFCLNDTTRVVIFKSGGQGSQVFARDDSSASLTRFEQRVYPVEVKKPFGAGDAYAAAICAGLCSGLPLRECVARGAAAAAIVVAGDSCCESSPDTETLEAFIRSHSS